MGSVVLLLLGGAAMRQGEEEDRAIESLLEACDNTLKVLRWRRYALYVAIVVIMGLVGALWKVSVGC